MRRLKWVTLLAALAAAAGAGVGYGRAASELDQLERGMAERRPRLEELAPVIAQIEEFKEKREAREIRRSLVDSLATDALPRELIRALTEAAPAELTVERIEVDGRGFDQGTVTTPEGRHRTRRGARIEIAGRAGREASATEWAERLKTRGLLDWSEVANEEDSDAEPSDGVAFTLSGRLALPPGVPVAEGSGDRASAPEARR